MEKLGDFLNHIKDRLSNPLFGSFVLSWILFNWTIFIGLLTLTDEQLKVLNHDNFIGFVQSQLSWTNSICWPLISSIIYVVVAPLLKSVIQLFNSWVFSWSNKSNLKILQGSVVSVSKYISLRDKILEREKLIEKTLADERKLEHQLDNLIQQNKDERFEKGELKKQLSDLNEKVKDLKGEHVINRLQGKWYYGPDTEFSVEQEVVEIDKNGRFFKVVNDKRVKFMEITHRSFNPESNELLLVTQRLKQRLGSDSIVSIGSIILRPNDDWSVLKGQEPFHSNEYIEYRNIRYSRHR
ncbi:MAG: hypothetical protein R2813_09645 [Flavobacteriales bacterium]